MSKRIISLFAAGFLLLLAGCAKTNETKTTSEPQQSITLTVYIQQMDPTENGTWTGFMEDRLYADTNIKIDFYPSDTSSNEKLKQYMAAGTLPDIIGFQGNESPQLYIDAKLLLPLENYQDTLPSIFGNDVYQKAIDYSKNFFGNNQSLYLMPLAIGTEDENDFQYLPMLRWLPYKKIGEEKPETLDNYLDLVYQMFQTTSLNASGEKVYGFSLSGEWDTYSMQDAASLGYLYGIDIKEFSPLMETNMITQTTSSILQDNSFYKKALKFYFLANQKGLLDPDSRSQTYRSLEKKCEDGRVLFTYSPILAKAYVAAASDSEGYFGQSDGYAPVVADDMKIYKTDDQELGDNSFLGIVNTSEKTNEACTFLNWFYSMDTQAFLYNGPYGQYWELDKSGKPYMATLGWKKMDSNQKAPEAFSDFALLGTTLTSDGYPLSHQYWESSRSHYQTKLDKEIAKFLGTDTLSGYLKENNQIAESTLAVRMSPALPDDLSESADQVGTLVCKASWNMIYAKNEAEFEQEWDTLCKEAEDLGMNQIEIFYQQAWQKALKSAANL